MNVRHWLKRRQLIHRLSWFSELSTIDPGELTVVRLRGHSGLVPLPNGGAILMWAFDVQPTYTPTLLLRLSENEAQAVFEADAFTTGMIEPIRADLRRRWGLVMMVRSGHRHAMPFHVPSSPEGEFLAELDAAAARCAQTEWIPEPGTVREVGFEAFKNFSRARRELACA